MAFESVRGYIQFASGLGDMTKARAMEAAEGLMSLPLVGDAGKVAGQASALADQILEAASANRASLIALVRQEVDSSMERAEIARRADLEAARQVIAALATQVQELSEMVRTGRAGQAVSGAATEAVAIGALAVKGPEAVIADEARRRAHLEAEGRDAELEGLDGEVLSVDEALAVAEPAAAQPAAARRRPARASFARTGAAKTAATKATAKKATAKKATAKKATAKKATAKKATAKKATAKKATAKKATASKTAAAKKATTAKTTATTKTTAKKATASQAAAKKTATKKSTTRSAATKTAKKA